MIKLSFKTLSNLSFFVVLGSAVFTSNAVLALNIYNQDTIKHEVEVNFKDGTTNGPLDGNTRDNWYSGNCVKGCQVKVKDVGQVTNVKDEDLIVIKDGTLTIVKSVGSQ